MKILTDPDQIHKELKRLLKSYSKYSWAVAWASTAFNGFDILAQNKAKIKRLVVGIHFYQTHPDFIAEFIGVDKVRFVMKPDGIFHPKIYLFENDRSNWECIIGSPNFTQSAFTGNSETAVLITSNDMGALDAYEEVTGAIKRYWKQARYLDHTELDSYRNVWKRKRRELNRVSGQYGNGKKRRKSPMDVAIFKMPWSDFFQHTKDDPHHSLEGRLKVLETARQAFEVYSHFGDMDIDSRRGIAGIVSEKGGIDWGWFGSMAGAGRFKKAIVENNEHLSLALDQIPASGDITVNHYVSYIEQFSMAFPDGGAGIATATRLLAMKRPDYFVCLDSKNKKGLCEAFEIPQSITFSNYWEVVIERIIDSVWWSSKQPSTPIESEVWLGRAAFLDSLFYDP